MFDPVVLPEMVGEGEGGIDLVESQHAALLPAEVGHQVTPQELFAAALFRDVEPVLVEAAEEGEGCLAAGVPPPSELAVEVAHRRAEIGVIPQEGCKSEHLSFARLSATPRQSKHA